MNKEGGSEAGGAGEAVGRDARDKAALPRGARYRLIS